MSLLALLSWAATTYLRKPKPLLLLAAFIVLPVSAVQSCLLAGVSGGQDASSTHLSAATVDSLAPQTPVETASAARRAPESEQRTGWLPLANLIQGFLLFGLALPIACGALAVATADYQSGGALPEFADLWPLLVARAELFLISLLPAALLVALGNVLFVLPGLFASILLIYVPLVVLFEKVGGRAALRRSVELVKQDAVRTLLAFLVFALAGFAAALLTLLLVPPTGNHAAAFFHHFIGDILAVAILPIPALVLGRLYLDARGRGGMTAEQLSRAARS